MYDCNWLRTVLDDLADIYVTLSGSDQERLAAGVEALNRQLALDPFEVGESRVGGERIAFPPLLQVWLVVDKARLRVRVSAVLRYGR